MLSRESTLVKSSSGKLLLNFCIQTCRELNALISLGYSFIMHSRKSALVIEHDFLLATYLADRVVVFSGKPAIEANASPPQSLLSGMNQFLKTLNVTFRRDPENFRPRVNKLDSVKDREQKSEGRYVSKVIAYDEEELANVGMLRQFFLEE